MTKKAKIKFWPLLRRTLVWCALVLALLLLVFTILHWQTRLVSDGVKDIINSQVGEKGHVQYKDLKGSLISNIRISDLSASVEPGLKLRASFVEIGYNPFLLLFGKVKVSHIFVDQLEVELTAPPDTLPAEKERNIHPDSLLYVLRENHIVDSLLAGLPDVDINNVQISARLVRLVNQPVSLKDLTLHVDRLRLNKKAYHLVLRKFSALWQEKNFRLRSASFRLNGNHNEITLNQFNLKTDRSSVNLSAFLKLTKAIDINLNIYDFNVDFADLVSISNNPRLNNGQLSGSLTLSGSPAAFALRAEMQGFYKDKKLNTFQADFDYTKGLVDIHNLLLQSNGGNLRLKGRIDELKKGSALLEFENINLRRFDPGTPLTNINGRLKFNINNLNLARAEGSGSLMIHDSQIDSLPIQKLNFNLKAQKGNFTILSPSFLQLSTNARFNLEGTLNRKKRIDWMLSTFDTELAELAPLFGVDSLKGRFDGQFHAMGRLFDPDISGNLWLPRLQFTDIDLDSLSLQLFARNIFSSRIGEGKFEIKKGTVAGLPLSKAQISARINGNNIYVDKLQFLSKENYLNASLNVRLEEKYTLVELPFFKASYQNYWLQSADTLRFIADSSAVTIEQFLLRGPQNSGLEFNGFWDMQKKDFQSYITFDKFRIDPFQQFWQNKFELSGLIDGTVELLTPLTDSNMELDITLDSLRYNGVDLGQVHSSFQFANEQIYVQEINIQRENSFLRANGDLAFSLKGKNLKSVNFLSESTANLKLQWFNIDLAHYTPLLKNVSRLSGFSSGYIKLSGRAARPVMRQYVSLEKFRYDDFRVDSLNFYAAYDDGIARIDSLNGILNDTHFSLSGWYKYRLDLNNPDTVFTDKPFFINLHSKDDQITFISLIEEQLESIKGDYELDLNIGGTPEKPALLSGMIRLDDGEIGLSRVRQPLKHVQFDAAVNDSVLVFNTFSAVSPRKKDWLQRSWLFLKGLAPWSGKKDRDGLLNISGEINLANLLKPGINLAVKTNEFYVDYFIENASVVLNTDNLSLAGQDTLFITGDITIPQGVFEVNIAQMLKKSYLSETTVTLEPPYTAILLDVHLPGNFVITSSPLDLTNNFKISIEGDMQAIMEPGTEDIQLSGHLGVQSGRYSAWNQNFEVSSGTIDFRNPKEINPDIQITAAKMIDERLFELIVSGSLNDLNQEIRVTEKGRELELSYLDKISLLTLGADISQLTNETGSTLRNVGEEMATTTALTAVQRGAEKLSGLDKVEINSSESLLDLEKMRLNNGLQEASITFGKYLTSDLYIEYRTQFGGNFPTPRLSWDSGNRLGLQYRISRAWSLDSYYEKTERGNNKIQIGLNWEYTF